MAAKSRRRFHRVAVLMGGPSAERAVSLRSGTAVVGGLREAGYEAVPVDVTDRELDIPRGVEAVFIALHGEFGEDGGVQRRLDRRGLPYTGSGARASKMAFDKKLSKRAFVEHGIATPAYEILCRGKSPTLPVPVVVKPTCQGSSIGVRRVRAARGWPGALADALRYGDEVLVEAYIRGRELTVGILDDEVLPVIEIEAPDGWYDYRAKYRKGKSRYHVPAAIPPRVARSCRDLAMRTFEVLGCRGFARVDLRLSAEGKSYVLELNSIPGFTETSLLPKAAAVHGIGFPALCDRIMNTAQVG